MSTNRPLFTARRSGSASGREVVDQDRVRVAYIPARDHRPDVLDRRASIIAAALMHDALSAETLRIMDTGSDIEVWDGGMLLASFAHGGESGIHAEAAARCAGALADGYLLARRLCLGERT